MQKTFFTYHKNNSGLLLVSVVVVLVLSALPLGILLLEAVKDLHLGKQSPLLKVLLAEQSWQAAFNSLYVSTLATVISTLLGSVFAFAVSLCNVRFKSALLFCFMLPMMIPPQVTALSWVQLFGPASPILNTLGLAPPLGTEQPLYSPLGIALLMGIQHAPLFFLALRSSLLNIPKEMVDAAQISGAKPWQILWQIIMPLCRYGFVAGISIAFISSLGNFGIPAMLGIPVSYYVLPTLIYQHMAGFGETVLAEMASLSLLVAALALLVVWLQQRLMRNKTLYLLGDMGKKHSVHITKGRWLVELILWLSLVLTLLIPLLALLISALVPALGVPLTLNNISLKAFAELFALQGVVSRAFSNSLLLASLAAFILMGLGFVIAHRLQTASPKWRIFLQTLIELPYALPGVVLSVACILLFVSPLPFLQISLYGSLSVILFAYLSRFLSVALKPIYASMSQLDNALQEAAQLCGASRLRRLWDIVLPLILPALFAGGLLVFLIAVNELTLSALLWSAGTETLGVLIYNLDESGDSILASAIAIMVVLMVALIMAMLSALATKLPKGIIPWQS